MENPSLVPPLEILLIEDNPGDVRLTSIALKRSKMLINLNIVQDGNKALAYLRNEGEYSDTIRPDLIFLDLNLPGMDGRDVLAEIKTDPGLSSIPVVVLTCSSTEEDVMRSYALHANCFITKPVDLNQFIKIVSTIEDFWFTVVRLPRYVE
jgi:chemotaxis family two-component system response regulator Rcp1